MTPEGLQIGGRIQVLTRQSPLSRVLPRTVLLFVDVQPVEVGQTALFEEVTQIAQVTHGGLLR